MRWGTIDDTQFLVLKYLRDLIQEYNIHYSFIDRPSFNYNLLAINSIFQAFS